MNEKSERAAMRCLIANLPPPDAPVDYESEVLRLVVRLGLNHPMTLSAAMKVVATEMPHGRLREIERTARVLYALLRLQNGDGKGPPKAG